MRQREIAIGDQDQGIVEDARSSVVDHLDGLIERMSVEERSEPGRVQDAKELTVRWYDRLHRAYHGVPLSRDQVDEAMAFLDQAARGSVAKWNARQLADELGKLQRDVEGSGLKDADRAALRARIGTLRDGLERRLEYRREDDDALVAVMDLIKKAPTAWGERRLRRLEPFLDRHRWWL